MAKIKTKQEQKIKLSNEKEKGVEKASLFRKDFPTSKLKNFEEIEQIAKELKKQGKKIITCNGCFDILHMGHIKFLTEAKQQGDILIVGLNSDSSVKQNKGPERPINSENDRAEVLAALEMVDYITIFNEKTPTKFLETIKPNIHANGEEYGKNCAEAETVRKHNGKIYLIKLIPKYSTTKLIEKIVSLKNK